jgi:hypothetical protein
VFSWHTKDPLNMKTTALPIIAFLAAIAAFVFLPMSAVAASIAFSIIGMLWVVGADYGKSLEPVRVPAQVFAFEAARRPSAESRAAA